MKILYLASGEGKLNIPNQDITYQDINGKRDISGDMLETEIQPYDIILATPPCNYYSRANYRRETSKYAQETKHLLPSIIIRLWIYGKPFIVENVRNPRLFSKVIPDLPNIRIIPYGRHTYWTNTTYFPKVRQEKEDIQNRQSYDYSRQGSNNVNNVFDEFILEYIQGKTQLLEDIKEK